MVKYRILMVCLGNICRSPLAHGILQNKLPEDQYFIDSAGTSGYHNGEKPDSRSIEVARNYGIDISNQRSRKFTVSDFDKFDKIYVMDKSNYKNVITMARNSEDKAKVELILDYTNSENQEVPDPYYGGAEGFNNVYKLLNNACEAIKNNLETFRN
ncbi:MAG: low molecular weight protein-tyrosine-phosphatase [bacterium]